MSTNCDRCGYRDNEVKSGSAISDRGKRITLKVDDREDLSRDILKVCMHINLSRNLIPCPIQQSETAGLAIPEIDLVLSHGTLGGRFTTLEGILNQVYEELSEKAYAGDSSSGTERLPFDTFLENLKEVNRSRFYVLLG